MFFIAVTKYGKYLVNANNILFIDAPQENFNYCTVYMQGGNDYSFIISPGEKTRIETLLSNSGKMLTNA